MPDDSEKRSTLRNLIASRRGSRNVDEDAMVEFLFDFYKKRRGERTFTEEALLTASQASTMEAMNSEEKELALECMQILMAQLRNSIKRNMS